MTRTVDARGLDCPEPKRRTLEALAAERGGEVRVLVDEPAALDSLALMLRVMGRPFRAERRPEHWQLSIPPLAPADGG